MISQWATFKTVVVLPSILALGLVTGALNLYIAGEHIQWDIVGVGCGIAYIGGLIRWLETLKSK